MVDDEALREVNSRRVNGPLKGRAVFCKEDREVAPSLGQLESWNLEQELAHRTALVGAVDEEGRSRVARVEVAHAQLVRTVDGRLARREEAGDQVSRHATLGDQLDVEIALGRGSEERGRDERRVAITAREDQEVVGKRGIWVLHAEVRLGDREAFTEWNGVGSEGRACAAIDSFALRVDVGAPRRVARLSELDSGVLPVHPDSRRHVGDGDQRRQAPVGRGQPEIVVPCSELLCGHGDVRAILVKRQVDGLVGDVVRVLGELDGEVGVLSEGGVGEVETQVEAVRAVLHDVDAVDR